MWRFILINHNFQSTLIARNVIIIHGIVGILNKLNQKASMILMFNLLGKIVKTLVR